MDRVLIANRGEIAVRIIRSCRALGITAIAIYSHADRGSKYVALADEAYFIGAAGAAASYLDGDKIIALARQVKAHAVHPGYGFLSENAAFAKACESAGIVFIGPSAEIIRRMGSKIESRRIAGDCGVPVVPGYSGDEQGAAALRREAEKIGTPLLIKASAGGGGRGMRMVTDLATFDAVLEQSVNEAQAAFGDGRVLIEKYVARPRHLEVQVLGDKLGHVVHLFERECSIQRNHQKVIEEAPAAFLDSGLRERLFRHALNLCSYIGYYSVGTAEFLLDDATGALYFLEMNTRLQVEHPVTETITGIDLVEWQIRVARGERLAFSQGDLVPSGWAIEARISAENPAEAYRPETGQLEFYREPEGEGIRVDSGVSQGSEITAHYDSLLAKLIASGDSREEARNRLRDALGDFELAGVGNNIAFLRDLVCRPAFLSQALTTHYIEQQFAGGWRPAAERDEPFPVVAALAWNLIGTDSPPSAQDPWGSLRGWRLLRNAGHRARQTLLIRDAAGAQHAIEYVETLGGYQVMLDGQAIRCTRPLLENGSIEVEVEGALLRYRVKISNHRVLLARGATSRAFEVVPQRIALAGETRGELSGEGSVNAPMPGAIHSVRVRVGDCIAQGDVLITMEAMKLMHSLCSSADGKVAAIHCQEGQSVEAHALLMEIALNET
jgi:3-methylcrotonyl-CoA carboxylase alpha subunit